MSRRMAGRREGRTLRGREEASSELAISWSYSGANSTLRVVAELDKDAWLSIAFPDIPCLMEPAVSVIALPQGDGSVKTNRYSINSHSAAGIKEMLGDDNGGIPSFVGSSTDDGKVKVELTKVVSSFPLSVTWARGFDRNLGYHGGSGRGCLEVSPPCARVILLNQAYSFHFLVSFILSLLSPSYASSSARPLSYNCT